MVLPYQSHSATSRQAAEKALPRAGTMRRKVYDHIQAAGARGATDHEIRQALGLKGSSQRPRRIELVQVGLVVDSERTRPTPGKADTQAVVWVTKEHAPEAFCLECQESTPPPKPEAKEKPKREPPPRVAPQAYPCPACEHPAVMITTPHGSEWCERQLRIVVLDRDEGFVVFEEDTGRYLSGRQANEAERAHFKAHKSLDGLVPWSLGREPHLIYCQRWKAWKNGSAQERAKYLVERRGRWRYTVALEEAARRISSAR